MRAAFFAILMVTVMRANAAEPTTVPDDIATGLNPTHMPIFSHAVHNSAFSPDGKRLAAGTGDGRVLVWDMSNDNLVADIKAHEDWAFSVVWSADGSLLASGGGDNIVRIWDAAKFSSEAKPLFELTGHTGDVHSVAFSADGKTLISAGDDKTAIIWDLETHKAKQTLKGHVQAIPTIALSPDGAMLATGSRDTTVMLWKTAGGERAGTLHVDGTRDIMSVKFSRDGKELIAAGYDGIIRIWDPTTKELLRSHFAGADVFAVAIAGDGKSIVGASNDGVHLWSGVEGETSKKLFAAAEGEQISHVTVSKDGLIAACSTKGKIYLIAPDASGTPRVLTNPHGPK